MEIEIARGQRGHFNLIHHETGFKADVYPVCDDLHRWGLSRALAVPLDGDRVSFAPPEYVIVRKLQFFREGGAQKHLRDISRMLAAMGEEWDRGDLMRWLAEQRLEMEWEQVPGVC